MNFVRSDLNLDSIASSSLVVAEFLCKKSMMIITNRKNDISMTPKMPNILLSLSVHCEGGLNSLFNNDVFTTPGNGGRVGDGGGGTKMKEIIYF